MDKLEFDWDYDNLSHLARHQISPEAAEEVVNNRPCDLGFDLRNGEERMVQIGETNAGRILIIVSTERNKKIRVVTGWPAKDRLRHYFLTQKRNGNAGRVEEEDVQE